MDEVINQLDGTHQETKAVKKNMPDKYISILKKIKAVTIIQRNIKFAERYLSVDIKTRVLTTVLSLKHSLNFNSIWQISFCLAILSWHASAFCNNGNHTCVI